MEKIMFFEGFCEFRRQGMIMGTKEKKNEPKKVSDENPNY
jgi:hypothetical protein